MSQENLPDASSDLFLQALIRIVNESDIEVGVVLSVGGNLISGQLAGEAEYFEAFGNEFANKFHMELDVAADLYSAISNLGEVISSPCESNLPLASTAYIHLKNAKYLRANDKSIPRKGGIWWRGRVTAIDGFSLGDL